MALHLPAGGNVEQVRATFSGVQHQSELGQMHSFDSELHARYGCDVSYEMPRPVCSERPAIHWYGPGTEPPWQEPPPLLLRTCCTERLMSMPVPLRLILMRAPSAEMEPCAQHEPQSSWRGAELRDCGEVARG